MKDRILKFLESEKISPAEFADKIGVQRSSMSHILNGRNQPSAAFIQKMLQVYPLLNSRWLMIGEGTLRIDFPGKEQNPEKPVKSQIISTNNESAGSVGLQMENEKAAETVSLIFPEPNAEIQEIDDKSLLGASPGKIEIPANKPEVQLIPESSESTVIEEKRVSESSSLSPHESVDKEIEQILFFYKDKTFSIYRPS